MGARPRIGVAERRARLVGRHHLARTAGDVVAAVRGVLALHSSDPLTPHLSAWARVRDFATADLDRALYETRALWRLHAMRRTLFVVPTEDAPVFDAAVGREIAGKERSKLEQWLSAEIGTDGVQLWLSGVEARVLEALDDGAELRTGALSSAVPELNTMVTLGSGKWTTRSPLSSRLLFVMAMEGRVVRTRPAGTWRSSQYGWAAATRWFGRVQASLDEATGRAELAGRYLGAYGPATLTDLRWWTGWTARNAAAALRDLEAVTVDLPFGAEGFVLAGDLETTPPTVPRVALLPALDSTPMGWKERGWYLGDHGDRLFDRNGNAGPTVWIDGRVVGGWAQRPDGEVAFRLLEDVGADAAAGVAQEAAALTRWLAGMVTTPRFRTPLERELAES